MNDSILSQSVISLIVDKSKVEKIMTKKIRTAIFPSYTFLELPVKSHPY